MFIPVRVIVLVVLGIGGSAAQINRMEKYIKELERRL